MECKLCLGEEQHNRWQHVTPPCNRLLLVVVNTVLPAALAMAALEEPEPERRSLVEVSCLRTQKHPISEG